MSSQQTSELLGRADALRWSLPENFHDRIVEQVYTESAHLAARYVRKTGRSRRAWERKLD